MAVDEKDEKEWSADSKALAACLEALLHLVRGQGGAIAPAANDPPMDSETGSCDRPSQGVAPGGRAE